MEIFQINLSDYNYLRDLPHIPDPPKKLFIRGKLPAKRVKLSERANQAHTDAKLLQKLQASVQKMVS